MPTVERYLQHNKEREELSKRQAAEAKALPADQQRKDAGSKVTSRPGGAGGHTADVPIGDDKTNILFHPPPEIDLKGVFKAIEEHTRTASYITAGTIMVLNLLFIGGGINGILKSLFPAAGVAVAVFFVLSGVAEAGVKHKLDKAEPEVEKIKYLPESVEWMNSLIDTVWQVISEEVFKGVAKTVEDQIKGVMPAAVGSIVKVKIPDIGQGTNAVRILSMRALPDSEFEGLVPTHGDDKNLSPEEKKKVEEAAAREEGGIFYNLEISVAYHGEPLATHKKRIHFDMVVMAGPVPLPIFVETKEFVMTLRVRMQLHPDIPFLKSLTFAFTETPKVHASVALGYSGAMNLLNLPFLDNFIEGQIKSNTADFVVPKSMNIDMTPYLGGDDAKLETDSVGMLFMKIHRAENLARQDRRGPGADPYITIAFSKYEKPMYATKMIVGDLNPIWEESCCVLINADHIKRQENLLIKLWDSDKSSPDDVTGQVEVPLQDLVAKGGQMFSRQDQLQEEVAGEDAQGILFWEVGYFPRAGFRKELIREDAKKDKKEEDIVMNSTTCRPDPDFPTGILSVSVYQCINIEVPNPRGEKKNPSPKAKKDAEDDDDTAVEGYLPSSYCTVDINDQFSMRTRVKSINKAPIFNSVVETYISDWRNIIVSVASRDSRKKGKDLLVGAVTLKAADIFKECSTVSNWYDLVGGEGTGRVRVAVLFRSVTLKMDKHQLGWDLGRFELSGKELTVQGFQTSKIKLRTGGPSKVLKASGNNSFPIGNVFRVPVFHRYLAPVIFEFYGSGRKPEYYTVIWLHNLIDNETREFNLTVYKTDNPSRFTQNVVESVQDKLLKLEPVGTVHFMGRFKSGMCAEFKDCLDDPDEEDTFEVFEAMKKMGFRDEYEADTGKDHRGVITGTGQARDPDSTYDEHVASGNHGVISDKEARNATSHRTGDDVASGSTMLPSHKDGITRKDTNLSSRSTKSGGSGLTGPGSSTSTFGPTEAGASSSSFYRSPDAETGPSRASTEVDNASNPHFFKNTNTADDAASTMALAPKDNYEAKPTLGPQTYNSENTPTAVHDSGDAQAIPASTLNKDLPPLPRSDSTIAANRSSVPDDYHPATMVSQPDANFSLPRPLDTNDHSRTASTADTSSYGNTSTTGTLYRNTSTTGTSSFGNTSATGPRSSTGASSFGNTSFAGTSSFGNTSNTGPRSSMDHMSADTGSPLVTSTLGSNILDSIRDRATSIGTSDAPIERTYGGNISAPIGGNTGASSFDEHGNAIPAVDSKLNAESEPAVYAQPLTRLT